MSPFRVSVSAPLGCCTSKFIILLNDDPSVFNFAIVFPLENLIIEWEFGLSSSQKHFLIMVLTRV